MKSLPKSRDGALYWILGGGAAVTLFIWPTLEDPFNAPKSWILLLVGLWLAGYVAFNLKTAVTDPVIKVLAYLVGLFLLALVVAFIATDFKPQGLFGDYARRTGFFTYFALLSFFTASAFVIRSSKVRKISYFLLTIGTVVAFYGLLQHFDIDFIQWNNQYNSVLSTLGNPDFAAAVMAIMMVLAFGILVTSPSMTLRIWSGVNVLLCLVTIYFSQARQGLLAGGIGISVICLVWIHQRSRALAYGFSVLGMVFGVFGILGMLNDGPLKAYFYKISVTFRGDYWRAGIAMFKDHLLFGVGLDRYGSNFPFYRDVTQVIRRGPTFQTNAAHSVPIQLAATGGIFVLIAFILVTAFIFWRGVVGLRAKSGVDQIVMATFLGAWLAYEAQSFISIDNVGIAIWGWILGGAVVGLSLVQPGEELVVKGFKKGKKNTAKSASSVSSVSSVSPSSFAQPLVSAALVLLGLIVVIPAFLADSSLRQIRTYAQPTAAQQPQYLATIEKPLKYSGNDSHTKIVVAQFLAQNGGLERALVLAQEVHKNDPRNIESLNLMSLIYEQSNRRQEAIKYRTAWIALDPVNYAVLYQLGVDLKAVGDLAGAHQIIAKIDAFAPNTDEAKKAHAEF